MKILVSAAAAWLAMTGVAHAQSSEAPKMECCEKMEAEGKECCCKDMAEDGHAEDGHAEHGEAAPEGQHN